MNYNAFFIKPSESLNSIPEIIPVSARHIVTVCASILYFLQQIKQGTLRDFLKRSAHPYYQVEIHDTKDSSLFKGSINEAIEFVREVQS